MLTKRIIPCLDVNNGRVVKGVNFVNLQDAGDPVAVAKAYDEAGADEVVFLDMEMPSTTLQTAVISSLPRPIRESHMMGIICQKGQSIPYISPSPLQLVS